MKKLILMLIPVLIGTAFISSDLNAQFTDTKESAFLGAQNLLNNAIARKYVTGDGIYHNIVKVSFTEQAILITERIKEPGQKRFSSPLENSYYKISWSDMGIFEFSVSSGHPDMLELKIHFTSDLSYKHGSDTEEVTKTITLMVLAKDKDQMDKFIKSIQHFCTKP